MTDETSSQRALAILSRLIAFDTTSRNSNLELIAWVESHLDDLGIASRRIASDDGAKANLLATIGPQVAGGVVLSGHTDVVPVDGQAWTSDPFVLERRGDRLFGRGTADMKGFIALALAAAPEFAAADLQKPVHFALSYDEEVGCLGAPRLIDAIARTIPRPAAVIVGEPTDMRAVASHKGIVAYEVEVVGREAHSSQPHLGVSAVMMATRLMARLDAIARKLELAADPSSLFEPKGATLTIGLVQGGTASNILARTCRFVFDLRNPPGLEPRAALAEFFDFAAEIDARIKAAAPEGGVTARLLGEVPALAAESDGAAERFARGLAGDNGPARAVSFAAEAGQFQGAGYSVVVMGPGSIDQAHRPDEYLEFSQLERGGAFMTRLVEALAAPSGL
jgi:acetylornithine deacetylase